jgi:homoaconitase/3-isopropylmalate dehydratase large subunit
MGLIGPGENAVSNTNRNFKGRMSSSEAGAGADVD